MALVEDLERAKNAEVQTQSDGEPGAPTYRSPKHPPSGRRSSPETARQPSPSAIGHWR